MAIRLTDPPANAYQLLAEAISRISGAAGAVSQLANVADPSKLCSALHHQVYTLSASDIVQGRHLDRARLTAWRFLIQYGSRIVGAVELSCDVRGGNLQFSSVDVSPFGKATRDLVAQLEKLESVRKGSYELRLLKAPSVYVMAVWLKNLKVGEDIVTAISAAPARPSEATAGGASLPQPASQFLKHVRASAKDSLRFDSSPAPSEPLRPGAKSNSRQ